MTNINFLFAQSWKVGHGNLLLSEQAGLDGEETGLKGAGWSKLHLQGSYKQMESQSKAEEMFLGSIRYIQALAVFQAVEKEKLKAGVRMESVSGG